MMLGSNEIRKLILKENMVSGYEDIETQLQPDGLLVMSGFYTEDIHDIKTKAENLGLKDSGFKTKNNWVAYRFKK